MDVPNLFWSTYNKSSSTFDNCTHCLKGKLQIVFLGYPSNTKGYLCLDSTSNHLYTSEMFTSMRMFSLFQLYILHLLHLCLFNFTLPPALAVPSRLHPMKTRAQNWICKPKSFTDGTDKWHSRHAHASFINDPSMEEPTSFTTASKQPIWRQAMNEFNTLLPNGIWDLVCVSSHMNIIGCKWVFQNQAPC